jgi:hypothetical protein
MEAAPDLSIPKATVQGYNPQAIYPRYMIEANGGNADALVVSDNNKGQFFSSCAADADRPVKIPILVCDAQWDPDGNSSSIDLTGRVDASVLPANIAIDKRVLDPPLQGGNLIVSGTWTALALNPVTNKWDRKGAANSPFAAGDIDIDPNRSDTNEIRIKRPAAMPGDATHLIIKSISVQGAASYLGEYSPSTKKILVVHDPNQPIDSVNSIVHEVGHAFNQVPKGSVDGVPAHPIQVDLGQGNHCRHLTDKCVMFDSGRPDGYSLNEFCEKCHPHVLVEDMAKLK